MRELFTPYGAPPQEPTYEEIDKMAGGQYPDFLIGLENYGIDPQNISPADIERLHEIDRAQRPLVHTEALPYLSDDEVVLEVKDISVDRAPKPPSVLKIVMNLTKGTSDKTLDGAGDKRLRLTDVGEHGPAVASLPGSEDITDLAQRRFVSPHIRDALLFSKILRHRFPRLERGSLTYTAEKGGITKEEYSAERPFRQERPGKAMLVDFGMQDAGGRAFAKVLHWGFPIYTSVDAAPLFLDQTADYIKGDYLKDEAKELDFLDEFYRARDDQEHPLGQFYDLAIDRLLTDLDESPDGFVEFKNLAPVGGMLNMAWADSAGAYVHKNGEWANHKAGIAAIEVQGYAYDSLIKAADIYRQQFQEPQKADMLEARARLLKHNFLTKFFVTDERGTYAAMGRDYDELGSPRNLEVRHVNMGLLLESGILDGNEPEVAAKREAIIKTLFSPEMLTKYGIRSLSKLETAYQPGGDHTGSIWGHINELVARGLLKHGYNGLAFYLRKGNWMVYNELHETPEYIRGDSETEVKVNPQDITVVNTKYLDDWPHTYKKEIRGQKWQAWMAAAVLACKYAYGNKNPIRRLPIAAEDPDKAAFEAEILSRLP